MLINTQERDAVYKTIFARRDVRAQFTADPIPEDVLTRILTAAHHAPSVGFSQPWDFILVRSPVLKAKIKQGFDQAHAFSATLFDEPQRQQYRQLKLEGILEAPLGICITCDKHRYGPVNIGSTVQPYMEQFSSVCAVQNLWLAARAENLGIGWVSIIEESVLRKALNIPEHIGIIAYLCVGYVSHFKTQPELESAGWLPRRPLANAIHEDGWQAPLSPSETHPSETQSDVHTEHSEQTASTDPSQ